MLKFKDLLTRHREDKGLSKTELAEKIGKSLSYISALEAGRDTPPTYEVCVKLAEVLSLNAHAKYEFLRQAFYDKQSEDNKRYIEELEKRVSQFRLP